MALTDTKVRSAKPEEKEYSLVDGDGMSLLVKPNGSKYWRFRFRFGGKQHLLPEKIKAFSVESYCYLEWHRENLLG